MIPVASWARGYPNLSNFRNPTLCRQQYDIHLPCDDFKKGGHLENYRYRRLCLVQFSHAAASADGPAEVTLQPYPFN